MTIRAYNQAIQKINLPKALQQAVEEKKEAIADLQAIQMIRGQKRDGNLMPQYSERSIAEFGKPPGPWRLYDTGSFYRGLTVKDINKTGWTITSTDDKTGMLMKKAGKLIFGLNDETRAGSGSNAALATEIIYPELKKQCEIQAGIKL